MNEVEADSDRKLLRDLHEEVELRFGIVPNLFRVPVEPRVIAAHWKFARLAYLDNPLSSLFKERLFVYLSRFCAVRYAISWHTGLLIGRGYAAGDSSVTPRSPREVTDLLMRPVQRGSMLDLLLARLQTIPSPLPAIPENDPELEEQLFACATHIYLESADSLRCTTQLRSVLGDNAFQYLLLLISFVRHEHFWTKTQPSLRLEADLQELLDQHEKLANIIENDPEAHAADLSETMIKEHAALQEKNETLLQDALDQEKRNQRDEKLLDQGRRELRDRSAKSEANNRQIAEARRAALNIMEDALAAKEALEASESRQAFLLALGDALSALEDAGQIKLIASGMIAKYLDAHLAYYSELAAEEEYLHSPGAHHGNGMTTGSNGSLRLEDLSPYIAREMRANRAVIVSDLVTAPVELGAEISIFESTGVRAFVAHPVVRSNRLNAILGIACASARSWKEEEFLLIREVAERIWAAVDRARSEQALHKSQALLEKALSADTVGVLFFSLDGKISNANRNLERMSGYTLHELTTEISWDMLTAPEDFLVVERAAEDLANYGETAPYEKQLVRKDGSRCWGLFAPARISGNGREAACVEFIIDISESKEAEEALRRSEDRFRTLADSVPHLIWANDRLGAANYFNHRWFEYTGLSFNGSKDFNWESVVHPDDSAAVKKHWNTSLKNGEVFDMEYRIRRADGAYRWHIGRTVPLRDQRNEVVNWFGSATDIDDLKAAEEMLRTSNEKLRVTMASATDYAIITLDPHGIIEGWSEGAQNIFGYSEDEVLGQSGSIIFTPEDRKALAPEKEMNTAVEEGRAADERWHLRKDGSRFFMSGVMTPIYSHAVTGFVKVARDMTEQKKAEEALRITEERYRIALQAAELAAWDWRIQENAITWNDQHFIMLGAKPKAEPVEYNHFLKFIHADDIQHVNEQLRSAAAARGTYNADFRIVREDNGHVRWMSAYGRVVASKDGNATRMVGVMWDITERKALEQQKEEFIGIASHELKTPVTSIKAYAELIEDILLQSNDLQNLSLVKKLDVQVDRLNSLIRDLLDTTKITEGQLTLKLEQFSMKELIFEKVEDIQPTSASHRFEIKAGNRGMIEADRDRIGQVLTNLLSNAIKYSPSGGKVTITCKAHEDGLKVSVRDQGIGLPDEEREKVFERFFRIVSPHIHTYPGMGLGLYISSRIIQRHGGKIWVESKLDHGSTFHFTLPNRI